jgi:hypothetical protein
MSKPVKTVPLDMPDPGRPEPFKWGPKPGEPGYWNRKLGEAKTDAEFLEAYAAHKAETEKHGRKLRPYDVLCTRLLHHFGQYKWGDSEDDPAREEALLVLLEVQRYLALSGADIGGLNAASSIRRRTLAEFEADISCVGATLLGFERSRAAFSECHPADSVSPSGSRAAMVIDLGCTEEDDHDPPPCHKCEGIREQVGRLLDASHRERDVLEGESRNAGMALMDAKDTPEDAEKKAKESHERGDAARRRLLKQREEREEAEGGQDEEE